MGHQLKKVEQEALRNASLQGISPCERVTHVVGAVEEEANKVPPQIATHCVTPDKAQVPKIRILGSKLVGEMLEELVFFLSRAANFKFKLVRLLAANHSCNRGTNPCKNISKSDPWRLGSEQNKKNGIRLMIPPVHPVCTKQRHMVAP